MGVPRDVHTKLQEIKNRTERTLIWILSRAVNNYYKVTLGNTKK